MSTTNDRTYIRTIDGERRRVTREEADQIDLLKVVGKQKPKTEQENAKLMALREKAIGIAEAENLGSYTMDEPGLPRVTVFRIAAESWDEAELSRIRGIAHQTFNTLFDTKVTHVENGPKLSAFLESTHPEGTPKHALQQALATAIKRRSTWSWKVSPPRKITCARCGEKRLPVKGSPVNLGACCEQLYNMDDIRHDIERGELNASRFNHARAFRVRNDYVKNECPKEEPRRTGR